MFCFLFLPSPIFKLICFLFAVLVIPPRNMENIPQTPSGMHVKRWKGSLSSAHEKRPRAGSAVGATVLWRSGLDVASSFGL